MTTTKLSTPALCGSGNPEAGDYAGIVAAVSIPHISMKEALELIAKDGCENWTSGIASCFEASKQIGAPHSADSVCHGCLAYAALKSHANRT